MLMDSCRQCIMYVYVYLQLAKEVFSQKAARQRQLFNLDYIDTMLAAPDKFTGRFGSKLWQVTLLELWLQQHNIE